MLSELNKIKDKNKLKKTLDFINDIKDTFDPLVPSAKTTATIITALLNNKITRKNNIINKNTTVDINVGIYNCIFKRS